MRESFKHYRFDDIDTVHTAETKTPLDNYLIILSTYPKKYIRHIDGNEIKIKGNIYRSKIYKDEVYQIYKKVFIRSLKENHLPFYTSFQEYINSNHIESLKKILGFFPVIYNNFIKLYRLYIFELDK